MCGYFGTKKIVLLNYPLGLSLLKYRNVWVFWNKKKSGSNRCSPLNSSIDDMHPPKGVGLSSNVSLQLSTLFLLSQFYFKYSTLKFFEKNK